MESKVQVKMLGRLLMKFLFYENDLRNLCKDSKERTLAVRVRSTRSPKEAIIKPISETTATVELVMAEEGIAPGQACVFYDIEGTRIYGGGWITNN